MASMLPMAVAFGSMYINNNYIKQDDPNHVLALRILFGVSQAICLAINLYIMSQAKAKKDTTMVTYKNAAGEEKTVTVGEYDVSEVMKGLQQVGMGLVIIGFIHVKWGYLQPLLMQGLLNPINLFSTPLFQIYVLNQPATGKLARPFVTANPLGDLMKSVVPAEETTTPAAAAPAETLADKDEDKKTAKKAGKTLKAE